MFSVAVNSCVVAKPDMWFFREFHFSGNGVYQELVDKDWAPCDLP